MEVGMSERTVVLLGELAAKDSQAAEIVRRVGLVPLGLSSWEASRDVFRRPGIIGVVFPASLKGFEELCVELRSEVGGEDLPLITVVPTAWDAQLERLFMFGIDDYVAADNPESLEPKLLALGRGNPWSNLKPESGRVIVADPERSRRVLYGRMLRRKGLGVDFAVDRDEVARMVGKSDDILMIIASAELPPKGARAAIKSCRAEGGRLASMPWIVEGTTEELEQLNNAASTSAPLRLFNRSDPPESVLFLVNELLSPPPGNARKSPRVLFGAPATFRVVGSRHLVPAFTYNINKTGVFIRTLVPPPRDSELILDFRPPFGEGRVRTYGRVVWRKECSQQGGPVVPAGMGVIYTRLPVADAAALDAGYAALLEAAPGQRSTNVDQLGGSTSGADEGEQRATVVDGIIGDGEK
jgi:CheY-like chemotaxis protein